MANVKISDLPAATAATGADVVPIVQSGTTKKLSFTSLLTSPTLFGSGVSTFLATPSSANLAAALTDETGSGAAVFATSPTLVTPTLGAATATSVNKVALTAPATGATLTIADGKTLTANNSLTLAGTDATTMTFPTTSASIARTDAGQTFTGTQTVRPAATQDAVALAGRAGGTSSYVATLTPATLSASRTVTLPDANTTIPIASQTITFSGPSAARTYTLPDASTTLLSTNAAVTVPQGGTGLTSGTSGGLPYFNATNTMASSGLLTANALMIGGGAGAAPSTTTTATGILTFLGTPSSANLAAAVTDETGSGSLVFATSPTITGPTISSGNLSFSSTAQRITGDFSNATQSNRLLFQTSTANSTTSVGAIPSGTGVQANVALYNSSDPLNASVFIISAEAAGVGINSNKIGTGSFLPITFSTNGSERLRILTAGGITSADLADAVGYKGTPFNEQSTAYTLVIGDMGKSIVHPASDNNARTFTIPANGTVAFPVGTTITFINMINTLTIAITTDTMYLAGAGTTGSRTLAAYGMATAVKMTSTTWLISGNGLT